MRSFDIGASSHEHPKLVLLMDPGAPHSSPPGDSTPGHARDEEFAQRLLSGEMSAGMRFGRRFFRHLPADPRCKLCASPFRAPFGPVMRAIGKAPWPNNPKYCRSCLRGLVKHHGGAEIECSLLFADVRESTQLAESMRPGEFRALMGSFFATATAVLVDHDAIVDKYVGDEVIGIFVPLLTGERHAERAVAAARDLLAAVRDRGGGAPSLPVGAGVHTGVAYVGTVGEGEMVDLTAMGDPVNVTARLASAAGAGVVLVTLDAARAAGLDTAPLEHRSLALKGKSASTDVVVLH
jgi:adenylate cyclase